MLIVAIAIGFIAIIAFDVWAWRGAIKDPFNITYIAAALFSPVVTVPPGALLLLIACT